MPSYVGVAMARKNGNMATTAFTFWTDDEMSEGRMNDELTRFAVQRWSPSKGWSNHVGYATAELSRAVVSRLLEHSRDDVDEFGDIED